MPATSAGTRGRCLPYGEGVTYWALAEMVRTRASIAEGEEPAAQREKLHIAVEQSIADPDERRFVEPRLAHLLGLEEHAPWERENLFSAWRLFYERLAEEMPTVMVFEDMEWADAALLDFIEHLVDWSKNHSLFVLVLARPELAERRPTWGAARRNFSSLYLEPLSTAEMETLLAGSRAGAARRAARADPRAGRGSAAVRGRDGAHAARPRPAGAARELVRARRARSTSWTCPRRCTP